MRSAQAKPIPRLSVATFAVCLTMISAPSIAQTAGVVVAGEGDCKQSDRVVIETRRGFSLAQQYRGSFDKGDQVFGELNRYGFKEVQVNRRSGRIYIDDYMASEDTAKEWCLEN